MFENVTKWIVLLVSVGALIACDEDKATGDSHAGANSVECHVEGNALECIETNPYVSPVTGDPGNNEVFGSGEVAEFKWDETIPWFLPSKQHAYGFDLDPLSLLPDYVENGKDVYVSVKTGEMANVRVRVDPESKKEYHLHKIDSDNKVIQEDIFTGLDICKEENCIKEVQLPLGDYAVYYNGTDKKRYIHVIEYDEEPKNIDFVQFGDVNGATCSYSSSNGCYTRDIVETHFNEIYKQAVVKGVFKEKEPKEIGLDDILVVDLTEQETVLLRMNDYNEKIRMSLHPEYKAAFETYTRVNKELDDAEQAYNKMQNDYNECLENKPSYSCVYDWDKFNKAQNKIETLRTKNQNAYRDFIWSYNSINTRNHHVALGINEMRIKWDLLDNMAEDLKNYSDFNKACTIYNAREYEEGCLHLRFPMYLSSSCGEADKEIEVEMYEYNKEKNVFSLNLYNAGNFKAGCKYSIYADVHPFVPGLPSAVQYTLAAYASEYNHAIIGGMVWGSHISGESSFNVICHEIGHSYGLTDLYIQDDDPTMFNGVASNETNLMNNATPIGPKLRYRPLEVVSTSTNDRIKLKGDKYATENQWECIRSNEKCYKQ